MQIVNLHNMAFNHHKIIKHSGFKSRTYEGDAKYGMRPNASKRLADKKAWFELIEESEPNPIRQAHIEAVMDILNNIHPDYDFEYRLDWVDEFVVTLSTCSSWQF